MAKKSWFQKEKKAATPSVTARDFASIQKEHTQVAHDAGVLQYTIFEAQQRLEQKNKQLILLNQEGAARLQLDKAAKESEAANVKAE